MIQTHPFYYLLDRTAKLHPKVLKENDTRLDGFEASLVIWNYSLALPAQPIYYHHSHNPCVYFASTVRITQYHRCKAQSCSDTKASYQSLPAPIPSLYETSTLLHPSQLSRSVHVSICPQQSRPWYASSIPRTGNHCLTVLIEERSRRLL